MKNITRGSLFYLIPLVLYCALIYFISSLSHPPTPDYGIDWGDKINHAGAYGLMMIAAFWGSNRLFFSKSLGFRMLVACLFCMLYGATDEFHQYFVPGRESDVLDWVADSVGAALMGCLIYFYIKSRNG